MPARPAALQQAAKEFSVVDHHNKLSQDAKCNN
jgi:hypothetical protein